MKLSVIGAGYAGLMTAACLPQIGHDVFCSESDLKKLTKLQNGEMPIFEPHLEEVIKAARKALQLRFRSDPIWPRAILCSIQIDAIREFWDFTWPVALPRHCSAVLFASWRCNHGVLAPPILKPHKTV